MKTLMELVNDAVNTAGLCAANENDLARFVGDKGRLVGVLTEIEYRIRAARDAGFTETGVSIGDILDGRA